MPPIPEDEKRVADKGGTPEQPIPTVRSSFQKQIVLILAMAVLGLPVLVVVLGPPMTGAWILWRQFARYRTDARWRQFSVFEWTTHTVEQDLAEDLGWPGLASCSEFRKSALSGSGQEVVAAAQASGRCPELGPAQAWLLNPDAYFEWHRYVAPVLRFIPLSSVLFLLGLIAAYLLRVVSLERGPRKRPPPPQPPSTTSISARLPSGSAQLKS